MVCLAFLFFILFTDGYTAGSSEQQYKINYHVELEEDKEFVLKNKLFIENKFHELDKYFKHKPKKDIEIRILPYKRNKSFKSCGRIYGPYRIYYHSLKSLKNLDFKIKKEFPSSCFKDSYNTLQYGIVHEYIHTLTWLYLGTPAPKWLREGIAVSLSNQLKHLHFYRSWSINELRKEPEYNICSNQNVHPYLVSGPLFMYYEETHPFFIEKFLGFYKKNKNLNNIANFMKENNLSCTVSSSELVQMLKTLNKE